MRDISDLIAKKPAKKKIEDMTAEEYTWMRHLADVERMRDFSWPDEGIRWPRPVRPLWRN